MNPESLNSQSGNGIRFVVPPVPEAVDQTLAFLDELGDRLSVQELEDVRLLVGELVTNAIRHAGLGPEEEIRVRVTASPRAVWGEVCDPGVGFEMSSARTKPRFDQGSGWGLYILQQISQRFGIERRDGLNCVWFELRRGFLRAPQREGATELLGSFSASVCDVGGILMVEARGEAHLLGRDKLREALEEAVRRSGGPAHHPIVVDLSGVTYLDSVGVSVLVGSTLRARERGGEVHVVARDGPCRRVLRTLKLDRVFRIHTDVASALEEAAGRT